MKTMRLEEFYSKFHMGYDFIYRIDNQPDKNKGRHMYISDDRRVFNKILVAYNPNCIRFCDGDNNYMQIECISNIGIRNNDDKSGVLFVDLFCNSGIYKPEVFSFIVKLK